MVTILGHQDRSGTRCRVANHKSERPREDLRLVCSQRRAEPIAAIPANTSIAPSYNPRSPPNPRLRTPPSLLPNRLFYSVAPSLSLSIWNAIRSITPPTRPCGSPTRGSLLALPSPRPCLPINRPPFTTETQWAKPCISPTVASFGNSSHATHFPSHHRHMRRARTLLASPSALKLSRHLQPANMRLFRNPAHRKVTDPGTLSGPAPGLARLCAGIKGN